MEDSILIREFLAGDKNAFDRIYEKYSTELFRTAYLICKNRADAEDALQETFIALYRKAREITKPESLRYWLLRCLSGKAKDILRKRKREYPEESIVSFAEEAGKRRQGAEGFLSELMEQTAFEACLYGMPAKYREVLVLYYYNELSVKEIARLTGQLEGTVKSRLFQARKQVKQRLEEGGALCQTGTMISTAK